MAKTIGVIHRCSKSRLVEIDQYAIATSKLPADLLFVVSNRKLHRLLRMCNKLSRTKKMERRRRRTAQRRHNRGVR